ncbi:MAG: indolepyruvate oxidoreductase subunit beta [Clostridia bacterium]|nr:indolepyruvate oxidoreductase subunit beta [Clostridia bacterium]MBR5031740.1 indolepyruvate oxidoreductase subunit beta [Clostridia bacterium]
MSDMTYNILIAGVGGQGTLLASKLMGVVFMNKGYDLKVSEVHGMSQRGGSVVTYVRFGDKVASTVIEKGEADMVLSFELLESARWLPYLKKDGVLISNTQKINPMPVITGQAQYPEDIAGKLISTGVRLHTVDALSLAEKAGSAKSVNVVLLGVAAKYLGMEREAWENAIRSTVPPKTVEINLAAFAAGYTL